MKPSELLSPDDRERIEAAVREAEAGTSGEIVVAVVRTCDDYAAGRWHAALLMAALALLTIAATAPDLALLWVLAAQCAAIGAAHAMLRLPFLLRLFLSEDRLQAGAEREARRAFAEHGVRRTEARTGILIFIALFEHRVIVLGDQAVDRALAPGETWQPVVDLALAGIRAGNAAAGIIDAIARCGEILSHPLPAANDDRDEIPHGLIIED